MASALRATLTAALVSLTPSLAGAEEISAQEAFVEANILSIFYHELGHAVIDLMQVPIFGQEEDAADVMSVMLIDWLFDEDAAQAIAYDSAFGFLNDPSGQEEVAYWAVHGPDEQRYYNHVCLFYGANPDERHDLAEELGLPADRAESCPEEYELAADSWGGVFDSMEDLEAFEPMVFVPGAGAGSELANELLSAEVGLLNEEMRLPQQVRISVEACGEPNAFYDLEDVSIVFCMEFIPHLEEIFEAFSETG